eukprot:COSAG01_NODE_41027_length_456_cov_4.302521_1_plen_107_part_10
MIERGLRHSWLHGPGRPGARVPAPAVQIQDEETPRGSVERRHSCIVNGRVSVERRHSRSRIVKEDVEDQCGFQANDVFVSMRMPDATTFERGAPAAFLSMWAQPICC